MALNIQVFRTVAPEFNSTSPVQRNRAAALAELQVTEGRWRKKYDYAVALMTAHILKASDPVGTGRSGPVTSETVGSLSRSFGVGDLNDALKSTRYGREFLRIRKQIVTSPFVV